MMLQAHDPNQMIREEIAGRIGALARALPHCALTQLVNGVYDIRCFARDNGFAAVESLASRLESTIARGEHRAAVLTYLDAMTDAADDCSGPIPAAVHEAWLASVALRLGH